MKLSILYIFSYLLGAIPFGLLIAKYFYNTDIRTRGSGNTGATNVWRTLGKKPGISTLVLDILKGVVPVILARHFFPGQQGIALIAGLCAIVGHNWSIFLKLKGGKGVATSAGVFLALIPVQGLIAVIAFLIFFLSTGHVSVGSMAGALALFAASFVFDTAVSLRIVIVIASILILIKHIPNMKRLANGTEPKVKFR